jgi:hypothetical protein
MRKIVFIFMIAAVVITVGFYTFLEFRTSEIVYVTDRMETWAYGNEMVVRRLYNSGVDIETFFAKVEASLISAEFTEDEIFAAALASGHPEFYPAFYFSIYKPDRSNDIFEFSAMIKQEFAPGQDSFNFKLTNLHLEVMTDGPMISEIELRPENPSEKVPGTPVVSNDRRRLAIDLDNVSGYSFLLTGAGQITFQYTYDVVTGNLFSTAALPEQLLIVHANVAWNEADGIFTLEYINEPYSSVEDYLMG